MVHKGIRLFGCSFENARLLQPCELVFEYGVVMHAEERINEVVLVVGIGDARHLDHLLGGDYDHGGVQLGSVHPYRVGAGNVLDGGLALIHLGEVQVAALE
jgi:hypothetical protein